MVKKWPHTSQFKGDLTTGLDIDSPVVEYVEVELGNLVIQAELNTGLISVRIWEKVTQLKEVV